MEVFMTFVSSLNIQPFSTFLIYMTRTLVSDISVLEACAERDAPPPPIFGHRRAAAAAYILSARRGSFNEQLVFA